MWTIVLMKNWCFVGILKSRRQEAIFFPPYCSEKKKTLTWWFASLNRCVWRSWYLAHHHQISPFHQSISLMLMTRQKMDKKVAQHPFLVQTGLTAFLSTGGLSLFLFLWCTMAMWLWQLQKSWIESFFCTLECKCKSMPQSDAFLLLVHTYLTLDVSCLGSKSLVLVTNC